MSFVLNLLNLPEDAIATVKSFLMGSEEETAELAAVLEWCIDEFDGMVEMDAKTFEEFFRDGASFTEASVKWGGMERVVAEFEDSIAFFYGDDDPWSLCHASRGEDMRDALVAQMQKEKA